MIMPNPCPEKGGFGSSPATFQVSHITHFSVPLKTEPDVSGSCSAFTIIIQPSLAFLHAFEAALLADLQVIAVNVHAIESGPPGNPSAHRRERFALGRAYSCGSQLFGVFSARRNTWTEILAQILRTSEEEGWRVARYTACPVINTGGYSHENTQRFYAD